MGAQWRCGRSCFLLGLAAAIVALATPIAAQTFGVLSGRVTRADDSSPLRGVLVTVHGAGHNTVTDRNGGYRLSSLVPGTHVIAFRWLGMRPRELTVQIIAGETQTADVVLDAQPILLSEVVVEGVSRTAERVVEAPAAVAVVPGNVARDYSATGQAPLALAGLPGVDAVQNGVNDFNINTRGFNSTLNRRVLVLQDGRDLAIAFLGSQEWSALALPLEDLGRIEMVRGPGSALYGANAYSGVINITTPTARDVVGTKLSMGGGGLGTLRGDMRHALVSADGRVGVRVGLGYSRSDSWSRSRTNLGDLALEYTAAVDTTQYQVMPPAPGFELRPLNGQSKATPFGLPGPANGDAAALLNITGSGRVDYYAPQGSLITVEGGAAQVENEVFVTAIGRVQVTKAVRPWARASWAANRFHVMGWYSGRTSLEPQYSLASGASVEETSSITLGEAQYNAGLFGGRGHVVVGASARHAAVNSEQTLLLAADDDRRDWTYSGFGQLEYRPGPAVRFVGAARVDAGDLFDIQFSPRGAIVYSPNERHAVRFTMSRAFQTPSTLELFLRTAAGPPANLGALEAALRASALGPTLAGVPSGQLFTTSSAVPVLAIGNRNLEVEKITSLELGYKAQLSERLFITVDGSYGRLTDFVTDLLPGVNPAYGSWTAPPQVPLGARVPLQQAVQQALVAAGQPLAAAGLTRVEDSSTAIVVSTGNAGKVDQFDVEVGVGLRIGAAVLLEGNYTLYSFEIDAASLVPGDRVLPNTPRHKGNLALSYAGRQGLDARISGRFVEGYDWAAGVFSGRIPSSQTIDASVGFRVNRFLRVHAIATNLLDQKRYQIYGGSVIGRRILGGMTITR